MIKLFEHFTQDFDKYFKKNEIGVNFLWEVKNFLDSILLDYQDIRIDKYSKSIYLDIIKEDNYIFTLCFYDEDEDDIFIFFKDSVCDDFYPLLLKYFNMEISKIFKTESRHINEFKFLFGSSKSKLDKIKFSKVSYEEYKDTERFGL